MKFTNHLISNFVTKLNYGTHKRLRFLNIETNKTTLELLEILYKNGAIRSYRILDQNKISVYFKYYSSNTALKITHISTPGNRVYWSLSNLAKYYNNHNFSGFYIITTQKGLFTSDICLLQGFLGGEILLKVEI